MQLTDKKTTPLRTTQMVLQELPLSHSAHHTVTQARKIATDIMQGIDNRLLVIVGPCSIHDPIAALHYAEKLKHAANDFAAELFIIMRAYLEKPRTLLGWKGFINDPFLDNSFQISKGLLLGRKLLLEINELGIPTATEFLNPLFTPYYQDLIAWSAVGARTTASQLHRELASSLNMPVGFKNTTDGNIKIAIEAVKTAHYSHPFVTLNEKGDLTVIQTPGNPAGHIILRGAETQTNYSYTHLTDALTLLRTHELAPYLMVDCSHGNSQGEYTHQISIANELKNYIASGMQGIAGIMLESHLLPGKQPLTTKLVYGQSITDACIGWEETYRVLEECANAKKSA